MPVYSPATVDTLPATVDTLKDNSCFARIKKYLSSTVAIFDMVEMLLSGFSIIFGYNNCLQRKK